MDGVGYVFEKSGLRFEQLFGPRLATLDQIAVMTNSLKRGVCLTSWSVLSMFLNKLDKLINALKVLVTVKYNCTGI